MSDATTVAEHRRRRVLLGAAWLLAALHAAFWLRRGWVSYDEGLIGQSALRVLQGELPHRDFVEVYTGGLSYWNALAMRLFGVRLLAPRILLWITYLAWVPALWYAASRVARPALAIAFTALAVALSLPNYSAALPSWYNLFLATFSVAALLRHVERGGRRWLLLAGLAAGTSILFKVIGLWTVAAGLLALLWHEQSLDTAGDPADTPRAADAGSRALHAAIAVALVAWVIAAAIAVRGYRLDALVHWMLPIAALTALLVRREWASPLPGWRERLPRLVPLFIPYVAGALLPFLAFAAFYAAQGALPTMLHGVFVRPLVRVSRASWAVSPWWTALFALPVLALVLSPARWWTRRVELAAGVLAMALVLLAGRRDPVFPAIWKSLIALSPVFLTLGAVRLVRAPAGNELESTERFALLASAASLALIQFPFAAPNYYLYAAPLVVLGWLAALPGARGLERPSGARVAAVFYFTFAVWAITPAFLANMGRKFAEDPQRVPLAGPRGGLLVRGAVRDMYADLGRLVAEKAKGGYVYAGPDAPEVHFLTGARNPTPTIFDFLEDSVGRADRIRQAVVRHDVHLVVINLFPDFSSLPPDELLPWFRRHFPHEQQVGKFLVFWRD